MVPLLIKVAGQHSTKKVTSRVGVVDIVPTMDTPAAHNLAPDFKAIVDTTAAQMAEFYRKTKRRDAERRDLDLDQAVVPQLNRPVQRFSIEIRVAPGLHMCYGFAPPAAGNPALADCRYKLRACLPAPIGARNETTRAPGDSQCHSCSRPTRCRFQIVLTRGNGMRNRYAATAAFNSRSLLFTARSRFGMSAACG